MTIRLRQSTASQEVALGFFLDSSDGNTAETGLTIANTDILLHKTGATSLANKNSGGATHMSAGIYYAVLDATDTNTLGSLVIFIHVSGALPVRLECEVLPANVFDSLILGTDNLQTDGVQFAGQTITASAGVTLPSSVASPTNITAGTITTVTNLTNAPTSGDFTATMKTSIGTTVAASAVASVTGNVGGSVASVVGLTASNLDATISSRASATNLATVAGYIDTEIGDIQSRLPAALVSGRMDSSVGAMAANTLTASALATDAVTEIQTGLASAADLATLTGYVDTEIAAIKAKTDNLPASPAAVSDIPTAAVISDAVWDEAISGHAISGSTGEALSAAGASGDPWITALPGSYSAGQAGYILGTNLDVPVSTVGGGGLTASDIADEVETRTIAGVTTVGTVNSLAANSVNASVLATDAVTEIQSGLATASALATVASYVDTEVAAIKAKTDNLPASPAAASDVPTALQNADALLNRDMAAVSDTNSRTPLNAFRFIRNGFTTSGSTLSVLGEDDTTVKYTRDLTTDPAAEPIVGVN